MDIYSDYKCDWAVDSSGKIKKILSESGIAFLENVTSKSDVLDKISDFGEIFHHHDSNADGITSISNYIDSNNIKSAELSNHLGLTQRALVPHTDRSGMKQPPSLLFFWIERQSFNGGVSLFVDSHKIFEELSIQNPAAIEILMQPKSVIFNSEQGLIESSIFEVGQEGLSVRFRFDKMVYFSTEVSKVIPELVWIMRKFTIARKLDPNCGYFLNNRRWLHGRTSYFGERSAYRLLIK